MDELELLKRERNRLKAQREVRESMAQRSKEKRQLKSEIRKEKYAGVYRFGGLVKRASTSAVKYAKKKSVAQKRINKRTPKKISRQRRPMTLNDAIFGGGY